MTENELYELYDKFIQDPHKFTLDNLYLWGYNNKHIDYLLRKQIIMVQDNVYFINTHSLLGYAKKVLKRQDDSYKRVLCYEAILNINPYDKKTLFEMFIECIKSRNFNESFKYLDTLFRVSEEPFLNDYNFYLYLLSHIIIIPKKYQMLKNYNYFMEEKDLLYDDNVQYDSKFKKALNNIRSEAFKGHFSYAFSLYNDLTKKEGTYNRDYISKRLLYDVIDINKLEMQNLKDSIENENYYDALLQLKMIRKKHQLKYSMDVIKDVLELIMQIIINNSLPNMEIGSYEGFNCLKNIKNNNFKKALYVLENNDNSLKDEDVKNMLKLVLNKLLYILEQYKCVNTINYQDANMQEIIKSAHLYAIDNSNESINYLTRKR